jgi:DNA-binding GntR family transcriptional regulator
MEPSTTPARHQTKQEFVYHSLRKAIMEAELAPGARLRTEEIAQRLGVSPIPVREALQLLQSERLVETVPHVGARVARVSHSSIIELFTVMEGLELVATRTAAAQMTPTCLKQLMSLLELMDQALEQGNYDQWSDLNTEFHRAIVSVTGMSMLQEMTERALNHWDRIRRYYLKGALTQRLADAQKEHHLIVKAMHDQDYATLERLVRNHNQSALAAYTEYLAQAAIETAA